MSDIFSLVAEVPSDSYILKLCQQNFEFRKPKNHLNPLFEQEAMRLMILLENIDLMNELESRMIKEKYGKELNRY